MSSSVSEDLPAPPVPVMPTTGTVRRPIRARNSARRRARWPFSRTLADSVAEMRLATRRLLSGVRPSSGSSPSPTVGKSSACTSRLIMPCRPSRAPSSGEKILVTP